MSEKEKKLYDNFKFITSRPVVFLDLMMSHLVRSEFSTDAYGTSLTPTQAYILDEMRSEPGINIPKLASIFVLNKSTISRAITGLVELGYLTKSSKPGTKDNRKPLDITPQGKNFLMIHDMFNEKQVKELSDNLTASELGKLGDYLMLLADKSNCPEIKEIKYGPKTKVFIALRRITRGFGFLNGDFLDCETSSFNYLILGQIHNSQRMAYEIAQALRAAPNHISRAIQNFQSLGWVNSDTFEGDNRAKTLTLTSKGIKLFDKIETTAHSVINDALKSLSPTEWLELHTLFAKYLGKYANGRAFPIDDELTLVVVKDQRLLKELRTKLLEFLKSPNSSKYELSDSTFSQQNTNIAILRNNKIVGGIELSKSNKEELQNRNLFWLSESNPLRYKAEIVNAITVLLPNKLDVSLD